MTSEEIKNQFVHNIKSYNRLFKEFKKLKNSQETFIDFALPTIDFDVANITTLCDVVEYYDAMIDYCNAKHKFESKYVASTSDKTSHLQQIKYLKQMRDIVDDMAWLEQ